MVQKSVLLARIVLIAGVLLAGGSAAAAINWHNTWTAFAVEAQAPRSVAAVQSQATFQFWSLICLATLVAAVTASAWITMMQARRTDQGS